MKSVASLLTHTFTHRRKAFEEDAYGGRTESEETLGTVRGRLRPMTIEELAVAESTAAKSDHVLYVEGDEDVQRGDELEGAGVTLTVAGVRNPSYAGHHLEVDCWAVQVAAEA